ncbi:leucine zipper putative tumor suppressor 2 homolog [Gouania willdenowi]|uniref:Leucine zipper tumor suppressor 2 homolog n=1 Tax=Gouania willdenowi TaxID=441366 RepID=A0A8C5GGU4_GOUWI|nr:leucine zipper putative tumor suppressor 2 [Gouania willdenowi]
MALVQAPPLSETHNPGLGTLRQHQPGSPPPVSETMGSGGSFITTHAGLYADPQPGPRGRRPTQGSEHGVPQTKSQTSTSIRGLENGNGNYSYLSEDYVDDWNDNHVMVGHLRSDTDQVETLGINGNVGCAPPKLIPVSGKLEKNMEKSVLRPTAFKPVVPKSRSSVQYLSPRHGAKVTENQNNLNLLSPTHREFSPSHSEKHSSYSSGRNLSLSDSGRNSLSSLTPYSSTTENTALHLETMKVSQPISTHGHSNSDSGRSSSSKSTGAGSLSGRGSSGRSPGPSEGYEGVVKDLEDKLKERELELQQLRENLDDNEAAICQVYEEKQKRFELELEELRQSCATRMQNAAQKSQRAQQVLQLQVFQLQQEKKKLQEDFSQLLVEREQLEERCSSYEHEKVQLGPRLEETEWEVCQKSGEISLLKQQLKEVQNELSQRVGDVVSLRGQLRDARGELANTQAQLQEANGHVRTRTLELEVCENELQRRKSEAELLREKMGRLEAELANKGPGNRQCQVFQEAQEKEEEDQDEMERMRAQLAYERQRAEQQTGVFEEERRVWREEKDKVIRYQQQLQENYVQMYRRNKELELMLQELSLELEESREDDEGSGNEINFDEVAATEI